MVRKLPGMIDMAHDKDDKRESFEAPSGPTYPCGLCLCLTEKELEKLGISEDAIERGDVIHFQALAKATSTSSHDNEYSSGKRIELQIMFMSAEDEDEEAEEPSKKLYKKK